MPYKDKELAKAKVAEYREKNKEKLKEYDRNYYQSNKEKKDINYK
jgi:hypothetical protein